MAGLADTVRTHADAAIPKAPVPVVLPCVDPLDEDELG